MIRIDFSSATIQVEPDRDDRHLVIIETMETQADERGPGSPSVVTHHYDDGVMPTTRRIEEDVRVRSTGNRISREYTIDEPGMYEIVSGLRDNTQSRRFVLHFGAARNDMMHVEIAPGGSRSHWVLSDHLLNYEGRDPVHFDVNLNLVTTVATGGQVEYNRATSWERLLRDDDS